MAMRATKAASNSSVTGKGGGGARRKPLQLNQGQVIDDAICSVVQGKLTLQHGFGYNPTATDSLHCFPVAVHGGEKDCNDRLVMKVGNQVALIDPDSQGQKFLLGQSREVYKILHYSVNSNFKYLSVCESIRLEDTDAGDAQISIYSLTNYSKIKTLNFPSSQDFTYSEFTRDNKHLLGFIKSDPEQLVVVWQWEKDKLVKTISVPSCIKRVRLCTLSSAVMFSASGPNYLKFWYSGIDSQFKYSNFLSPAKENECSVIDHAWLTSHVVVHKMVALVDLDQFPNSQNQNAAATTTSAPSPMPNYLSKPAEPTPKRQCVYIFEGQENATSIPPISMDIRQTVFLKPIYTGTTNSYATALTCYSKGFILLGSSAVISIYDRTEEKRDPYIEVKRVMLGDFEILTACVFPSEEKLAIACSNGRVLSVAMDASFNVSSSTRSQESASKIVVSGESAMVEELDFLISNFNKTFSNKKNRMLDENPAEKLIVSTGASDIFPGGFHCDPIISADIAYDRALVATISSNRVCRVWNYETLKCELVHNFKHDEPICCSLHNSGYQLLVSFTDRVKLFFLLNDSLLLQKETIQKSCKEVKFSNGGQYWAGASTINIVVYETKTFNQLMTFQGHMMAVSKLVWAPGDQVLFSAGLEGNVYGWCVANPSVRLDVISANNRSSIITSLEVDSNCTSFPPSKKDIDDTDPNYKHPSRSCIVAYKDTNIKVVPWVYDLDPRLQVYHSSSSVAPSVTDNTVILPGDSRTVITALCLSIDKKYLFAGTSLGKLRLYPWPPAPEAENDLNTVESSTASTSNIFNLGIGEIFYEICAHSGPITAIKPSPMGDAIISTGTDGSVFITQFKKVSKSTTVNNPDADPAVAFITNNNNSDSSALPDEKDYTSFHFNRDILAISTDDMEDHKSEVSQLQRLLESMSVKASYLYNQKQNQYADEVKKILDHQEKKVIEEKKKIENLRADFEVHEKNLRQSIIDKEIQYVEMTNELGNRYERKIEEELFRFDRLNEEMEVLKQKFEGLATAEKEEFLKQLNDLKSEAKRKEKKFKSENRRISDEKTSDEASFKQILHEQETEYEDELKQLIGAAESELSNERETVTKLKVLVKSKNEKIDQLKKKLLDINNIAKARQSLLNMEIQQKNQLQQTIEHYKKNLHERETALSEKEKTIAELTSTTRTLENFRFVLDHRLQQLSAERNPITSHIEGLERHIATMYEELVEEFDLKKSITESLQLRETKMLLQAKDIEKMKNEFKSKEFYIASFKRDMDNIFQAKVTGKALEEAVNCVYRKYIRNEPIENVVKANDIVQNIVNELIDNNSRTIGKGIEVEDDDSVSEEARIAANKGKFGEDLKILDKISQELVDTARESGQQRMFKEQEVSTLRNRIYSMKYEGQIMGKKSMFDNSNLLYEAADMQKTIAKMEKELSKARDEYMSATRTLNDLKSKAVGAVQIEVQSMYDDKNEPEALDVSAKNSTLDRSHSEYGIVSKPSLSKFGLERDMRSVDLTVPQIYNPIPEVEESAVNLPTIIDDSEEPSHEITPKVSESINNFSLNTNKGFSTDIEKPRVINSADGNRVINVQMNRGNSASAIHGRPNAMIPNQPGLPPKSMAQSASVSQISKPPASDLHSLARFPQIPKEKKVAAALPHEKQSKQDKEVEMLESKILQMNEMLDILTREKDIQRLEITRIRKELAQKTLAMKNSSKLTIVHQGNKPLTPINSLTFSQSTNLNAGPAMAESSFENDSQASSKNLLGFGTVSGSRSQSIKVDRSLTQADISGKPSKDDLKRLALLPRSTNNF